MNRRLILELMDSAQERPLQSWTFTGNEERILIGRAPENDVVLSDPFVSRSHAYLSFSHPSWRVVSISSQQILFDGQRVVEVPLYDGAVFRLGANGCHMRFRDHKESVGVSTTVMLDPALMPVFQLDEEKMHREVTEIASSDYFQQLQQTASALRKKRAGDESPK